jgi:hypothetical protein
MSPLVSKLILAAAVAVSLPAAARADGCDHDRGSAWHDPRPGAGPRHWRDAEWRERRLQRIRAELHALDRERAEFHARNAWRPGRLRRYDRAWAEQRAELERRYAELQRVAWR